MTDTRKPLNEMSNEELRRETAEWLRWVGIQVNEWDNLVGYFHGGPFPLPNWPQDLNAAADLLKRMPEYGLYYLPKANLWGIYNPLAWFMREVHSHPARAITEAFCQMKRQEVRNG